MGDIIRVIPGPPRKKKQAGERRFQRPESIVWAPGRTKSYTRGPQIDDGLPIPARTGITPGPQRRWARNTSPTVGVSVLVFGPAHGHRQRRGPTRRGLGGAAAVSPGHSGAGGPPPTKKIQTGIDGLERSKEIN